MLINELTKGDQNEKIMFNVMEEIVRRFVDEKIVTMDMCDCEICRMNACAIALNALPAHYVTSKRGNLLAQISEEMLSYRTQVLVETTKALLKVKEHPLHEK